MKNIKRIIFSAAAITVLSVMAFGMGAAGRMREGAGQGQDTRRLAERLVGDMMGAYKNYSIPTFLDMLSDDFSPDRMQLANRVGDPYYKVLILEIDYFINEVLPENNTLAVSFKWQKKAQVKATGRMVKTEGNSVFVFKDENGDWKLSRINGQNPFL